jgi:hypothetical protein
MAHEAIVLVSAGNMPRPLAKVKCARDTKGIRRQSGLFLSEGHPYRTNLQSGASPGEGLLSSTVVPLQNLIRGEINPPVMKWDRIVCNVKVNSLEIQLQGGETGCRYGQKEKALPGEGMVLPWSVYRLSRKGLPPVVRRRV